MFLVHSVAIFMPAVAPGSSGNAQRGAISVWVVVLIPVKKFDHFSAKNITDEEASFYRGSVLLPNTDGSSMFSIKFF